MSLLQLLVSGDATAFIAFRAQILSVVAYSALYSAVGAIYVHLVDAALGALYKAGHLKRFYAPAKIRHEEVAIVDAFLFAIPSVAYLVFRGVPLSFDLNLLSISSYLVFYMVLHDTWFYFMHLEAHRFKLWYRNFHLRHHTMRKELNVFHVAFANHLDNFIDVAPGLFGYFVLTNVTNFWLAFVPLTTVITTASLNHSGYRSHWIMTMMHPLAMPVLVILGRLQLLASPGDHQMHHEHYTCNFGLFFRTWDHIMGTYRRCDLPAYAYGEGPWEAKAVNGQNATR